MRMVSDMKRPVPYKIMFGNSILSSAYRVNEAEEYFDWCEYQIAHWKENSRILTDDREVLQAENITLREALITIQDISFDPKCCMEPENFQKVINETAKFALGNDEPVVEPEACGTCVNEQIKLLRRAFKIAFDMDGFIDQCMEDFDDEYQALLDAVIETEPCKTCKTCRHYIASYNCCDQNPKDKTYIVDINRCMPGKKWEPKINHTTVDFDSPEPCPDCNPEGRE